MPISAGTGLAIAAGGQLIGGILGKNAAKSGQSQAIGAVTGAIEESNAMIQSAYDQASGIIAEANATAEAYIKSGNKKAAKAVIESAKIAANALLQASNASIAVQREFAEKANNVLAPTIKQGRYAANEMASMLGIPNAEGELVPFDVEKLTTLPAFKTGMRAIEHTAVGKKLSTQQAERAANFGADFFGQRYNQLGQLQTAGANAEQLGAQIYGQTGANLGTTYNNLGANLANVYTNQGSQLGNIYSQGAIALANNAMNGAQLQANLGMSTTNALSNNVMALGGAEAQAAQNNAAIQSNFYNQLGNLAMLPLYNSWFNKPTSSGVQLTGFKPERPAYDPGLLGPYGI